MIQKHLGAARADAVAAAEAFAALADEIVELALSREPTVEAWKPEEPGEAASTAG